MLRIDHVVRVVKDLDEAGDRLLRDQGLVSFPGGTHPRWGTANRIAPLGRDYVELISVLDLATASGTTLGRMLRDLVAAGDAWFALCLADDDIDATCVRLGLEAVPGSRERPDGSVVRWRGAGIEDERRTPDLPFFLAWDVPAEMHPGAAAVHHPDGATGIAWVEVAGDPGAFAMWTGGADLPVRHVGAEPPGIIRVAIATPSGEVVL
ncbi:MAG: VOC family protein [Actinomycetota bacterium]